jgi:2'-5' RNA ligase
MIHRCIMIFPKFDNIELLEDIRSQFDPLYKHVAPHISLVFPFKSELTTGAIEDHIKVICANIRPFRICLKGISQEDHGFMFLNIVEGKGQLVDLHQKLYQGLLTEFYPNYLRGNPYKPHMTVGRILDKTDLARIVEQYKNFEQLFEDEVQDISVEIIDDNEDSNIEITISLRE